MKNYAKILETRARQGGLHNYNTRYLDRLTHQGDPEDDEFWDQFPKRLPMRSSGRRYDVRKDFNDLLNPLRRFLDKNVNRPWDDIYSEWRSSIDRRSVHRIHVEDHLGSYVRGFKDDYFYNNFSFTTFYLDEEGVLRKREPSSNGYKPRKVKELYHIDKESGYFYNGHGWQYFRLVLREGANDKTSPGYRLWLWALRSRAVDCKFFRFLLDNGVPVWGYEKYKVGEMRSANKKEIAKHGLWDQLAD